jgi:hypothetical protein
MAASVLEGSGRNGKIRVEGKNERVRKGELRGLLPEEMEVRELMLTGGELKEMGSRVPIRSSA